MTSAVLDVRELAPVEWRVLRATRLRAVYESPHAFASDDHSKVGLNDHYWQARFRAATWVVARERGAVVGIAGLVDGQPPHEDRHVEWIWVAPTHRRRGVCRSMIHRLAELEGRDLLLWVIEDNTLAERVYAHLGFVWTGERQLIDHERGRYEKRMRLTIGNRPRELTERSASL